jgi:hypothetical protein
VSAVWTGISHAQAIRAMAVSATITVNSVVTFAPPPADAAPAMTAEQAWALWENNAGNTNTSIAPDTTVQLGLLSVLVGPDCGAECENGNIVQDGMVYSAANQLAYGYSWSTCSAGSNLPANQCTSRIFLDASTGKMIIWVSWQISVGANPAGLTASPSAG